MADHGLMHQHVVEHAAERIFGVGVLGRDFDRFRNRDAEAARRIRDAVRGSRARSRSRCSGSATHCRAIGLHQRPPVGLLIVGDLDHVDFDFEAEQRAGEGERGAPLPRARSRSRASSTPSCLVVEGLGHRGVGLVAAGGAHPLVFVENARAGAERLLEPPRAVERGRAPHAGRCRGPASGFRSAVRRSLPGRSAPSERAGERSSGPTGLPVPGCSTGRRRRRQIGDDVVPGVGNLLLAQRIFGLFAQAFLPPAAPRRSRRVTVDAVTQRLAGVERLSMKPSSAHRPHPSRHPLRGLLRMRSVDWSAASQPHMPTSAPTTGSR